MVTIVRCIFFPPCYCVKETICEVVVIILIRRRFFDDSGEDSRELHVMEAVGNHRGLCEGVSEVFLRETDNL